MSKTVNRKEELSPKNKPTRMHNFLKGNYNNLLDLGISYNLKMKAELKKNRILESVLRNTMTRLENKNSQYHVPRAERELGYTQEDFKGHIEGLWLEGMTWQNRSEWHIDHIKPISVFIKEGVTDIKIINSLDNLQPLWAIDNLKKGANYNY